VKHMQKIKHDCITAVVTFIEVEVISTKRYDMKHCEAQCEGQKPKWRGLMRLQLLCNLTTKLLHRIVIFDGKYLNWIDERRKWRVSCYLIPFNGLPLVGIALVNRILGKLTRSDTRWKLLCQSTIQSNWGCLTQVLAI